MKHFVECIQIKLFKTVAVSKGNIGSPRNSRALLVFINNHQTSSDYDDHFFTDQKS